MSEKKNKDELQEIGKRLEKAIKNAGLLKKDIADLLNVTPQTISNYLNGRRGLSYIDAVKISQKIGINVSDLLTSEQKTRHVGRKTETFTAENDILVELFKLLGYNVEIENNDKLNLEFYIEQQNAVQTHHETITELMSDVIDAQKQKNSDAVKDKMDALAYYSSHHTKAMLNHAVRLTQKEWNEMRTDIFIAVTSIIVKRTSKIEIDRSDMLDLISSYAELTSTLITEETLINNPELIKSLECFQKFYAQYHAE